MTSFFSVLVWADICNLNHDLHSLARLCQNSVGGVLFAYALLFHWRVLCILPSAYEKAVNPI